MIRTIKALAIQFFPTILALTLLLVGGLLMWLPHVISASASKSPISLRDELEVFLSIIGNLSHSGLLMLYGFVTIGNALLFENFIVPFVGIQLGRGMRIANGILIIIIELAMPGTICWFIDSFLHPKHV